MGVDLYYIPGSAPCRTVLMVAKVVGVDLNLKLLDLMKKEQMKPEYLKINPQHTVPCLVDGDLVLTESRAIATYLINKYGKDDSLYPKDAKKRAVVDQRLYFDMGTVYQRYAEVFYPVIFEGKPVDEDKLKRLEEAYKILDVLLSQSTWAAGDNLTVADIALVASVSTLEVGDFDLSKYPNVAKWLAKCKTSITGYAETNEEGVKQFKAFCDSLKKK